MCVLCIQSISKFALTSEAWVYYTYSSARGLHMASGCPNLKYRVTKWSKQKWYPFEVEGTILHNDSLWKVDWHPKIHVRKGKIDYATNSSMCFLGLVLATVQFLRRFSQLNRWVGGSSSFVLMTKFDYRQLGLPNTLRLGVVHPPAELRYLISSSPALNGKLIHWNVS